MTIQSFSGAAGVSSVRPWTSNSVFLILMVCGVIGVFGVVCPTKSAYPMCSNSKIVCAFQFWSFLWLAALYESLDGALSVILVIPLGSDWAAAAAHIRGSRKR